MATKNNPGAYDCYANADPDEPMFVLLARDKSAPSLVKTWVNVRLAEIAAGLRSMDEMPQLREAQACAEAMQLWHRNREIARAMIEGVHE